MNILVTGGCGYIGSNTCVELLKNNQLRERNLGVRINKF